MYHSLFIRLSADRHLGCFCFLAVMNNAAVDICGQDFVRTDTIISLGDITGHGIATAYGNYDFNFLRNCQIVFKTWLHHFTFPPGM